MVTRSMDDRLKKSIEVNEEWLPAVLLLGAVGSLVIAVLEVEWVPETGIVSLTAILGLLMGTLLAKRSLSGWKAWILIIFYGLLITTIWLGQLRPPFRVLFNGWRATRRYWLQNGALFLDRVASWFNAVFSGGRSQETIVFAFGLGLLAWLMAAYVGWSAFRQRRPLPGLTIMGMAVAVNGYYGKAEIWWTAMFVGFTALITAVMHFADMERSWQMNKIDYSDQIRLDLIFYAFGIAISLLSIALFLPSFRISKLVQAVNNNPTVKQAEESFERVFAGVRKPQGGPAEEVAGGVAGGGGMPRSYLIGDAPELYETVVMTAEVSIINDQGQTIPVTDGLFRQTHWRSLSYDIYTGPGWALSEEREAQVALDSLIELPPVQKPFTITQQVNWLLDSRRTRYTLGLPLTFGQETTVFWRGLTDLSRVQGEGNLYHANSRVSQASPSDLRQTAVTDIPPAILARYTDLPATVPVRVHELAQEVAGDLANPYDQARALERFLRQYPYSLEVDFPPAGVDPVDFFLFEQQEGYCDYYASSMTVMARSLGLPARIGIGYLPQPSDDNGIQTIYQINGHSWTEIYFPGYGWIEFEPTAAFPSPHDESVDPSDSSFRDFDGGFNLEAADTPSIPEPDPRRPFPWNRVAIILTIALGLWLWRRWRATAREPDWVLWAYGRLQIQANKLGHPTPASQTPAEFIAGFMEHLNGFAGYSRLKNLVANMRHDIERLADLFIIRQYSQKKKVGLITARESWHRLRRPFWMLRIAKKIWRIS